jgi:hypothetical protein
MACIFSSLATKRNRELLILQKGRQLLSRRLIQLFLCGVYNKTYQQPQYLTFYGSNAVLMAGICLNTNCSD